MPSAARTTSVRGPEGHLTKVIGNLWARTLFSLFDLFTNIKTLYPLIAFRRLPCSSSTGINNRAAGRRAVGSVFCFPFRKCTLTIKLRSYYRDSYVIGLYRDGTPSHRLPGLAKNSPTPTPTATQLYHRAVRRQSGCNPQPVFVREFCIDGTTFYHLPGFCHLDNYIMTGELLHIYLNLNTPTPNSQDSYPSSFDKFVTLTNHY